MFVSSAPKMRCPSDRQGFVGAIARHLQVIYGKNRGFLHLGITSQFSSVLGDSSCYGFVFLSSIRLRQEIPTIWRLDIFGIDNLFIFSTRNLQITIFGGFLLISRVLLKILVGKLCLSFIESICATWYVCKLTQVLD